MRAGGPQRYRPRNALSDRGCGLGQRIQNSSTTRCSRGAHGARSPSPGRGQATRTTAVTSNRRTGQRCATWWATTATTLQQKCCYSTRFGGCKAKLTNYFPAHNRSWYRRPATVPRYPRNTTKPQPRFTAHDQSPRHDCRRIVSMKRTYSMINPQATQRPDYALIAELFALTTTPRPAPTPKFKSTSARLREATDPPTRAS